MRRASRILGKPFTVSEFNYCYPNSYRAECGAVYGAYSALQGYDALYRYNYSEHWPDLSIPGRTGVSYNMAHDPMQYLSEKQIVMLFLRGDVKMSDQTISIAVDEKYGERHRMTDGYPYWQTLLGLVVRTGSVVTNASSDMKNVTTVSAEDQQDTQKAWANLHKEGRLGKGMLDPDKRYARSSTGEIELDCRQGRMTIASPRSELVVLNEAGTAAAGGLNVRNHGGFASISLSSLDGLPLTASKRMILFHLTNTLYSGSVFADRSMTFLKKPGTFPVLARRGVADLRLQRNAKMAKYRLQRLDFSGMPMESVPVNIAADGAVEFQLDTFAGKHPCFIYELTVL